ncbi:hypothetical protein EON65_23785 [archaeon]|nr:MAG: hypothetical protein EON65_23785 [archaeon]
MKAKTNFEYNPRDVTTSQQPSAPSVTASSQNAGNSGDEGAQAKSRHTGRAYVGVKLKKREWMTSASEAPSLPIPPMIPPKSLITASMINGAHNPAAAANALLHLNQLTSGAFMMPHGIPIQPMHMLPHIPPLLPPIDPHSTTAALHTMNLPLPPVSHASTLPAMSTHVGQGSSGDWSKHPYTPLEISPPPAYHPVAAVNEPDWRDQIYYWVGQLRFDEKGKCLVWEGKWMGSFTGKPPKEELESSTNDFSYKSVEVSKSSVMQGTGGLVPYSGLYHGYHLIDTEGEEAEVEREKFEEKDVLIEFEEVAGGHSATHQACGRGESEFGVFILNGSYVCTTGILEMSRQYLADHDLRCTMTIAQLKQYFKATGGRP